MTSTPEYPDDIMRAAREAAVNIEQARDPNAFGVLCIDCESLESAIAAALAAERERSPLGIAELRSALERQTDNMAFVINHASLPDQWQDKFTRELEEDRKAIRKGEQP